MAGLVVDCRLEDTSNVAPFMEHESKLDAHEFHDSVMQTVSRCSYSRAASSQGYQCEISMMEEGENTEPSSLEHKLRRVSTTAQRRRLSMELNNGLQLLLVRAPSDSVFSTSSVAEECSAYWGCSSPGVLEQRASSATAPAHGASSGYSTSAFVTTWCDDDVMTCPISMPASTEARGVPSPTARPVGHGSGVPAPAVFMVSSSGGDDVQLAFVDSGVHFTDVTAALQPATVRAAGYC